MAEAQQHIDFIEVKAEDIMAERLQGWELFTQATKWGIGAVIVLLAALYLLWG
ncbi:preprotein translocase subunit SecE [Roseomonas sp. GC11]|uniref:preprotein translocase subunit SecE n=1 Tax=Roseomonas sp. GC11 TaxID=2950546 RepID=UPI002109EB8F|nr:preprotein translocase subunit SecE [Roseomonas sp. GC11]MCQ4162568.1 preprotein translocase subunit SecE [Roseomonas sp. GC11]